jgi:hypothetical protein
LPGKTIGAARKTGDTPEVSRLDMRAAFAHSGSAEEGRHASGFAGAWSSPEGEIERTMGHERFPNQSPQDVAAARAALEALFTPRGTAPETPASKRDGVKKVTLPQREANDPARAMREKLLARLLAAQGRPAVSKAAEELVRGGFSFPSDQEVMLQLLEHADKVRVRDALQELSQLLEVEPPKRRTVLESRLRRLEENAEETATREAAATLRRKLARTK